MTEREQDVLLGEERRVRPAAGVRQLKSTHGTYLDSLRAQGAGESEMDVLEKVDAGVAEWSARFTSSVLAPYSFISLDRVTSIYRSYFCDDLSTPPTAPHPPRAAHSASTLDLAQKPCPDSSARTTRRCKFSSSDTAWQTLKDGRALRLRRPYATGMVSAGTLHLLPIALALQRVLALEADQITVLFSTIAVLFGAGDTLAQQGIEKKGMNHDVGPIRGPGRIDLLERSIRSVKLTH